MAFCHSIVVKAGNPVKIGDGCATVTGYNLPKPLVPRSGAGKAGERFETRKSGHQPGYARRAGLFPATSPSKRRMRPARGTVFPGTRMPSFSVTPESGGFLFS